MHSFVNMDFEMNILTETLLDWYADNKRDLPWRDTADPYRIWISEIILQQTRVVQGYEYFLRFIRRFPDVETLAAASEDEVLKYWQGLGYYSRARNLHAAAKSMNGKFPASYQEVRALKGVAIIRLLPFVPLPIICRMRWWTEMFIAYFPAIGALILPLIQRKERGFLLFWPMRCLINPDLRFITKLLWILELFSVHRRLLIVCFALWPIAAQLYRKAW